MNSSNRKLYFECCRKVAKGFANVLKPVTEIGNAVLLGAAFGSFILFPPLAIPLKICAGASTAVLSDMVTCKTHKHINQMTDEVIEVFDTIEKSIDESLKVREG